MKKINILIILLIFTLVSCQQDIRLTKNKTKINKHKSSDIFMKIDTINGEQVIDDRCGVDAPNIRIFNDSLYYYYPTEGSYYKIINQEKSRNTISYSAIVLPSNEDSQQTNFKITKLEDSSLKVYIDEVYVGIFVNFNIVGKKIQIYHRKDCEDKVEGSNNDASKNVEFPIFESTTWSYDCKTSDYVTFTLNIGQFNFYKMDFGINTTVKKINDYEYELRFKTPPIAPIPEDMDWKNYSQDNVIAKIRYEKDKMELTWLGFYNTKTKKREFIENPFTGKVEQSPIILKKCDE